jgi:hypothetical protein
VHLPAEAIRCLEDRHAQRPVDDPLQRIGREQTSWTASNDGNIRNDDAG